MGTSGGPSNGPGSGPRRARTTLDRALLGQQDEHPADQPAEHERLRRGLGAEDPDDQDPDHRAEDRGKDRLEQPEHDLDDQLPHQSSRRPCRARISVTSSAYSRSPPTGSPRAIRVTAPTRPSSRSPRYIAVASPSSV